MKNILTIGGSSSKNSINKQLAVYAGSLVENAEASNIDLIDYELPLYSIDKEQEFGFSQTLMDLNSKIENADGFVVSLAEHNGAYSAAFKNTFDWLSRIDAKVWRNKPMLLMSTSPGARGGQSVLELAKSRFPYNGGNIVASMSFPSFYEHFKEGKVNDPELAEELNGAIDKFKSSL